MTPNGMTSASAESSTLPGRFAYGHRVGTSCRRPVVAGSKARSSVPAAAPRVNLDPQVAPLPDCSSTPRHAWQPKIP